MGEGSGRIGGVEKAGPDREGAPEAQGALAFWEALLGSDAAGAARLLEEAGGGLPAAKAPWGGGGWEGAKRLALRRAASHPPSWLENGGGRLLRELEGRDLGARAACEAALGALMEAALEEGGAALRALSQAAGGFEGLLSARANGWVDKGFARQSVARACLRLGPKRAVERLGEVQELLGEGGFWGDWFERMAAELCASPYLTFSRPSPEEEAEFVKNREPVFKALLGWAALSQARGAGGADRFAKGMARGLCERFATRGEARSEESERVAARADAWAREALVGSLRACGPFSRVAWRSEQARRAGRVAAGAQALAEGARAWGDGEAVREGFWGEGGVLESWAQAREYHGPLGPLAEAFLERFGAPGGERLAASARWLLARGELAAGAGLLRGRELSAEQMAGALGAAVYADGAGRESLADGGAETAEVFAKMARAMGERLLEPRFAGLIQSAPGAWRALFERALMEAQAGAAPEGGGPRRAPRPGARGCNGLEERGIGGRKINRASRGSILAPKGALARLGPGARAALASHSLSSVLRGVMARNGV